MAVYLNGTLVTPTRFPDNTQQVWKLPDQPIDGPWRILWEFEDDRELITVMQLKYLLARFKVELEMPYLPYARQDHVASNKTCFGLFPFLDVLEGLRFESITCFDPHSNAASRKLSNFKFTLATDAIRSALTSWGDNVYDTVVYPDGGAADRYEDHVAAAMAPTSVMSLVADKVRDQATGRITHLEFSPPVNQADADDRGQMLNFLIVDDIADGGATFVLTAEAILKTINSNARIGLYVSHALFTRGFDHLVDAGITEFFTRTGKITPPSVSDKIKATG